MSEQNAMQSQTRTPDEAFLDDVFAYHVPDERDQVAYEIIREWGKNMALMITHYCPPCADRSAAIRKVREAVMTANAAIALKGKV